MKLRPLAIAVALVVAATGACNSFSDATPDGGMPPGPSVDGGADAPSAPPSDGGLESDAADSGADATDAAKPRLVVFITVSSFSDVTTAASADTKCKGEATGRVPGTFVAWYPSSSPKTAAADRLVDSMNHPVDGPWFRLDGLRVAASRAALTNTALTPLENAITINAAGAPASGSVWTGTFADGGAGIVCPGINPTKGLSAAIGPEWTNTQAFTATCGSSLALYCFQVE
jgi:hypothetical protein